jgi:hypothetical protein
MYVCLQKTLLINERREIVCWRKRHKRNVTKSGSLVEWKVEKQLFFSPPHSNAVKTASEAMFQSLSHSHCHHSTRMKQFYADYLAGKLVKARWMEAETSLQRNLQHKRRKMESEMNLQTK